MCIHKPDYCYDDYLIGGLVMKKKNILFVLCGLFVAVALGAMLMFVLSENNNETQDQNPTLIELEGTWKVAVCVQNGTATLIDNEYFVFKENNASAYKNGESTPYASSTFELTASSNYPNQDMKLSDISRQYTMSVITENYIRLYESSSVYMELIRYANEDRSELYFDEEIINGKWNVAYRNTAEIIAEEHIEFANGELRDYRNGADAPSATTVYSWDDGNCISAEAWDIEMKCFPLTEEIVLFVEVGTGYVWELHKVA